MWKSAFTVDQDDEVKKRVPYGNNKEHCYIARACVSSLKFV